MAQEAKRESRGIPQRHAPGALPLARSPGSHCTGGWPFERVRRKDNLLPLPEFEPRNVQSVANRYISYATPVLRKQAHLRNNNAHDSFRGIALNLPLQTPLVFNSFPQCST